MKNAFSLAISSIFNKPLSSFLSVFSVACAIGLLCGLSLLMNGIENGFSKNSKHIDVVIGAKGSPLQLVLSSVYQIDIPNGNIEIDDAKKIEKNAQIKKAVPIAVGDSYKGWRVVGTTSDYLGLYDLTITQGRIFQKPFEVLAGASTGLKIGDTFNASHGFSIDSDDVHDAYLYHVVGVLERSGTVADKLLITPYQSVQMLHSYHGDHDEEHGNQNHHHDTPEEEAQEEALGHQITALLVQVKTPMAIMTLPREINNVENLLAASPSYEMARLSKNFGIGESFIYFLSLGLMVISVLMIFSNLASNLVVRQYDLAVIRVLGASPSMIFATVLFEGALIGMAGAITGLGIGHMITYITVSNTPSLQAMIMPLDMLKFQMQDLCLLLLGIGSGCLAALLPAQAASKMNITTLLSKGSS